MGRMKILGPLFLERCIRIREIKRFLIINMEFKHFKQRCLTFSKELWLSVISWLSQLRQLILGYTVWLSYRMRRALRYLGELVVLLLGYIKEILAILFGSIIISWLIFNRLFRERLPVSIPTFNTIYSWDFLFILAYLWYLVYYFYFYYC
jgi:hypothetical protein